MTGSSVNSENSYRIMVTSIGNAKPSSAVAVAKGLGISAAEVIRCLYRAPSVLVEKVELPIAEKLLELLTGIGYEVELEPCSKPVATNTQLFEVAIYLKDASLFTVATQKLADFLGMKEDESSKLLLTPPCTVLGGVSEVTIEAFKRHMADCVELIVSPQGEGLYHLFLADCPVIVRNRLFQDMRSADIDVLSESGLIAANVSHEKMNALWIRHNSNTALRAVNQQFLRYDLTLLATSNDEGVDLSRLSDQQRQILHKLTDIPEDLIDEVIQAAPVAIIESVSQDQTLSLMEAFQKAEIPVQADLITFQYLQLKINSTPDIDAVNQFLNTFSIAPIQGKLPQTTHDIFPEIQARVLQNALAQTGNEVELVTV